MDDSQASIATIDPDEQHPVQGLDFSSLPPVYVLAAHLSIDEQHEAEDALRNGGASLTYDINEAKIVLGNISKPRRAKSELQWKGVRVGNIEDKPSVEASTFAFSPKDDSQAKKGRKRRDRSDEPSQRKVDVVIDDLSTASEAGDETHASTKPISQLSLSRVSTSSNGSSPISVKDTPSQSLFLGPITDRVKVIKIDWLNDSLSAGRALSLESYAIYTGRVVPPEKPAANRPATLKVNGLHSITGNNSNYVKEDVPRGIIERANADPEPSIDRYIKRRRIKDAADKDFVGKSFSSSTQAASQQSSQHVTRPTRFLHQTTSEHDEVVSSALPPMPGWVREDKIYACERATPLTSPNQAFICQLKKIKLARLLTLDEIGVRAYSSSIASLAAYPYPIQSTREILALPSCDQKIAHLFHEYHSNGKLQAVADLEADLALKVLREFYEIWGVGAKTAREFYYDKGWRDLDDIIEHGWRSLSRVQQIDLKYYDEFMLKISRTEVESIAATITKHACLVTDKGIESIIVGGYRRGKSESGDVDLILSNRNETMTHNLVDKVVKSLEKEAWITHTLTLNLSNSKRDQQPLPINNTATLAGHGFDTLDKALVVWQDPNCPTKTADLKANPNARNPNPHRRVDIIVSPWRTVGCAVAGWTSGKTFQRDLRRYAKNVKGWKFDSSGVRQRGTGKWVDLEGWGDMKTRCRDWKEAERRVFEGMGLVYRDPYDRCTG